jgi:MFS family permease
MPGDGGNWKPKHSPWLIAIAVMIATFMEVMDTSIASVAVPYIAGSTASTNNQAEWVLTVYLVSNAVFLPASTWFSERFGRKRFLMFSVLVFTIASFACGIAPHAPARSAGAHHSGSRRWCSPAVIPGNSGRELSRRKAGPGARTLRSRGGAGAGSGSGLRGDT